MHITNAFKQLWLPIMLWVLFGGWITWQALSSFFERGYRAYLLVAAGYLLCTLFMCISIYISAPMHRERFSRRQIIVAKVAPFAALGISVIGLWLRRA